MKGAFVSWCNVEESDDAFATEAVFQEHFGVSKNVDILSRPIEVTIIRAVFSADGVHVPLQHLRFLTRIKFVAELPGQILVHLEQPIELNFKVGENGFKRTVTCAKIIFQPLRSNLVMDVGELKLSALQFGIRVF